MGRVPPLQRRALTRAAARTHAGPHVHHGGTTSYSSRPRHVALQRCSNPSRSRTSRPTTSSPSSRTSGSAGNSISPRRSTPFPRTPTRPRRCVKSASGTTCSRPTDSSWVPPTPRPTSCTPCSKFSVPAVQSVRPHRRRRRAPRLRLHAGTGAGRVRATSSLIRGAGAAPQPHAQPGQVRALHQDAPLLRQHHLHTASRAAPTASRRSG